MAQLSPTREPTKTWRARRWLTTSGRRLLGKVVLPLGVVAGLVLAYFMIGGVHAEVQRALAVLKQGDAEAVRTYITSFGVWAPVVSIVLMVLQGVAAPIPGFLIVFANGLAFGAFAGGLISLFGLTLAATVCFWLSRALGRGTAERLAGKFGLDATDRWLGRYGAIGIILARLVPGISFDAISYAAGLTRISFWRFVLATVIGSAPQTFLYAYLGQTAPEYAVWMLIATAIAIIILGLVLLIRRRHRRTRAAAALLPEHAASKPASSPCSGVAD